MKHNFFATALLSFALWSCNSTHNDTAAIIPIDIDTVTNDSLDIADFADSITYIDLKTPEDEFIGYIHNAKIKDKHIIIKDNNKKSPVALFDIDGNFISRIGHKGQGPGEYILATAVDIDRDTVYVYDIRFGYAMKYDFEGRYLGRDSIGVGDDFAVTRINGDKRYLLANYNVAHDDMAGVFLVDPDPFRSERILGRRDNKIENNKVNEFSTDGGTVRMMTNDFEYKLMRLDGDSLVCEYEFDITPCPDSNEIDDWVRGYETAKKYYQRTALYDAGRWLILAFSKIDNPRMVLFDKKNGTYKVSQWLKNSVDGLGLFYFQPSVIDGALLCVTIPENDENPRLMLAHLKK